MKQGYDKDDLISRLFMAVSITRAGKDVQKIELIQDKYVVIYFSNAIKKVNVDGDSGIALMKDVLKIFL